MGFIFHIRRNMTLQQKTDKWSRFRLSLICQGIKRLRRTYRSTRSCSTQKDSRNMRYYFAQRHSISRHSFLQEKNTPWNSKQESPGLKKVQFLEINSFNLYLHILSPGNVLKQTFENYEFENCSSGKASAGHP